MQFYPRRAIKIAGRQLSAQNQPAMSAKKVTADIFF
jgi:hypothetical protein